MKNWHLSCIIIMTLFMLCCETQARIIKRAKIIKIIDANTIQVRELRKTSKKPKKDELKKLKKFTVTLYGIYTPEKNTVIYNNAKNYLKREILNKRITLYIEKRVSKNVLIASVKVYDMSDVSKQLVKLGLAYNLTDDIEFIMAEECAKINKLELWAKKSTKVKVKN